MFCVAAEEGNCIPYETQEVAKQRHGAGSALGCVWDPRSPGDSRADALAMRMDDPAPAEMSGHAAVSGEKGAGRDCEMRARFQTDAECE